MHPSIADGLRPFLRKTSNKITGHGCFGKNCLNAIHHRPIIFHAATAFHPFQDSIRPALQRNVQAGRTLGKIANGLQQVDSHIFGIVGDKLNPLDAGDFMQLAQEVH